MMYHKIIVFIGLFLTVMSFIGCKSEQNDSFITVSDGQFFKHGKPYYYIGTNYWYGGVLGLEKEAARGIERLKEELDFLKAHHVDNVRVMVAVEGTGMINGVSRVFPPFQTERGKFDLSVLNGLDILLDELSKRDMNAILFLSNNWEWSGGWLQYIHWNGMIPDSIFRRKLSWDEQRDYTSQFYTCQPCKEAYWSQVKAIISRVNSVTGRAYIDEPAIMAWELANEPRPMRPAAIDAYKDWMNKTLELIQQLDSNHLITLGTEGTMGTEESISLFNEIHAHNLVDYQTIHIWPKNWSWFKDAPTSTQMPAVLEKTRQYIDVHIQAADSLKKPLVIEEFGLPRDGHLFSPEATTESRDLFYKTVFDKWDQSRQAKGIVAGVNFWGFGGNFRPISDQIFWKQGDNYSADPPQEEQGLNNVYDSDQSTWKLISSYFNK